ncbi:Similar to S.cerevisiae protein ARL3 (ARF-like small GTPase of the RAS superfamily) [Malassezia sympodialis ATCC 42132]|uniref:Similar to S.cerevisiae protein ARL3 (ARF-like small GTPase of the RAS superfamily) n=1 Tax=Malassezia sympodialis (strain ATCC 42132) TaxID=1230383 RepID=A0A1M8A173_MALS4|nr:Similar to S.cerevisiae protein ARL3 (ARF-like small GTPase of the RAS superfamily) [Malassezia sympodialis ATCC 42132]
MYHLVAGLYAEFTKKPTYNALLIGLKGSGKTWILERLRHDYLRGRAPSQRLPPTIGQNVLDVPYRRTILHLWDLGGSAAMRSLWDQYLPDAHVIVWVIDAPRWASDTAVADELGRSYRAAVFESLFPVIAEASARAQPVCVVVTQLDELASDRAAPLVREVETSVTAEWTRRLDDTSLDGTLTPIWSFQGVSAATGDGIEAMLDVVFRQAQTFATQAGS